MGQHSETNLRHKVYLAMPSKAEIWFDNVKECLVNQSTLHELLMCDSDNRSRIQDRVQALPNIAEKIPHLNFDRVTF
jgi:hypothetical protein